MIGLIIRNKRASLFRERCIWGRVMWEFKVQGSKCKLKNESAKYKSEKAQKQIVRVSWHSTCVCVCTCITSACLSILCTCTLINSSLSLLLQSEGCVLFQDGPELASGRYKMTTQSKKK